MEDMKHEVESSSFNDSYYSEDSAMKSLEPKALTQDDLNQIVDTELLCLLKFCKTLE